MYKKIRLVGNFGLIGSILGKEQRNGAASYDFIFSSLITSSYGANIK